MNHFDLKHKSILSGIQIFSNFSRIYFSQQNIDWLQTHLRYVVYMETGDVIGLQDESELVLVMRSIYLEMSENPSNSSDFSKHLLELNNIVIAKLIPSVLNAINIHKTYQSQALKVRTPMAHPVNVNITGTKGNHGFSDAMGLNTFK